MYTNQEEMKKIFEILIKRKTKNDWIIVKRIIHVYDIHINLIFSLSKLSYMDSTLNIMWKF